jgi:hypothetical protein
MPYMLTILLKAVQHNNRWPCIYTHHARRTFDTRIDWSGRPLQRKNKRHQLAQKANFYILVRVCHTTMAIHLKWSNDLASLLVDSSLEKFTHNAKYSKPSHQTGQLLWCIYPKSTITMIANQSQHNGILYLKILRTWTAWQKRTLNPSNTWLKRVSNRQIFSLEEFASITLEPEEILNSPPLTLRDSHNNLQPITPEDILFTKMERMRQLDNKVNWNKSIHMRTRLVSGIKRSFWLN